MGIVRKLARGVAQAGSSFLIGGPIFVPMISGVQRGVQDRNAKTGFDQFVYDASGFDLGTNQLNSGKAAEVVIRDAVLVGIGLLTRWVARRI